MEISSDISTIVLAKTEPREIGWLSLVNRSAAEHDAVWNSKLHALGYPSVPCPQAFYFLITSITDQHILFATLVNTGIVYYITSYITISGYVLDKTAIRYLKDSISPAMIDAIRPLVSHIVNEERQSWIHCVIQHPVIFDLVLDLLPPTERQQIVHHAEVLVEEVMKVLPVLAKYRLHIPMGRMMHYYSDEDYVRALLVLPWMISRDLYALIDFEVYEPYIPQFEAACVTDPDAYSPILEVINRASWREERSAEEDILNLLWSDE